MIPTSIVALYQEAACGQPDALNFLAGWHEYCHELDDVVDEPADAGTVERLLLSQARAACLFSSPFWRAHETTLKPIVLLIASAWGDSVLFEKATDPGLKTYADSLRLVGNEMVCAVALICGGFSQLRNISPRLRSEAWRLQHADPMATA